MFEVGLLLHSGKYFKRKSREDIAEWIAKQLKECGFPTKPIGSSWGVLINSVKEDEDDNKRD